MANDRAMMSPSLANAPLQRLVRIVSLELEAEAAAWLGAVGLHVGEQLRVLRRAALGGPLHVRTSSGGEFAVAREVAAHIAVEPFEDSEST
jgi:ferrous iron transport protein A